MYRHSLLPLTAGLLALAGCRHDTSSAPAEGRGSFSASWVGSDTGKLSGTPRAALCRDGNLLEILVSKGDVGVGLVVYPEKDLAGGNYPAFDPQDSVVRPGVAAAARWFTERDIRAFQSDFGALNLVQRGEAWSGGFGLHLRRVGADSDSIVLSGQFKGVVPGPCGSDSVSPPDSTQ